MSSSQLTKSYFSEGSVNHQPDIPLRLKKIESKGSALSWGKLAGFSIALAPNATATDTTTMVPGNATVTVSATATTSVTMTDTATDTTVVTMTVTWHVGKAWLWWCGLGKLGLRSGIIWSLTHNMHIRLFDEDLYIYIYIHTPVHMNNNELYTIISTFLLAHCNVEFGLPWAVFSMCSQESCPYSSRLEKGVARLWPPSKMLPVNGISKWPFSACFSVKTTFGFTALDDFVLAEVHHGTQGCQSFSWDQDWLSWWVMDMISMFQRFSPATMERLIVLRHSFRMPFPNLGRWVAWTCWPASCCPHRHECWLSSAPRVHRRYLLGAVAPESMMPYWNFSNLLVLGSI